MKFLLCIVLIATLAAVQVFASAGQSACKDPSELGQTYPHHFDPAKYWYCAKLNEPAEEHDCPKDMAYMHLLKECIPWANWIWKQPPFPPTLA